jgi:ATP-dependent DNA helicase RecG
MNDNELEALLLDLESDRVERTASASDTKKIAQAICAFANDLPGHGQPGVIFIGVHDDGACAELEITDELLKNLAGIRADGNILPLPDLNVGKRLLAGCEMAVIEVQPSIAPPVRFKGQTWIRVGPRRAIASRDEEIRLSEKRRARDLPFDLRPLRGASLADLDLDYFRTRYLPAAVPPDVLRENQRTSEQQLAAVRFLDAQSGCPTALGVLVAGLDPRAAVPGSYVQFVRFEGEDLSSPILDQAEFSGPILEIAREIETKFAAHNESRLSLEGHLDRRLPAYPLVALQQIMRNALIHRDYESSYAPVTVYWFRNRVEIHSPGGPFGRVTPENFGQPGLTDYRNPGLAEAMKNLGFVQRFGIGLDVARRALLENGNSPLEWRVQATHVALILGARP